MLNNNEKMARDIALIDSSNNYPLYRKLMIFAGLGYTFDAWATAMIAFILPIIDSPFNLTGLEEGIIAASTLIGYLVGATFWGLVGDKWGRKNSIQYTLVIYTIFTLVSAFASNFSELTIFRIIAGFGIGGESAVIAPYFSEFIPKKIRGKYTGYLTGFFSFGFVIAALFGYLMVPIPYIFGLAGWRFATIISALPVFYIILMRVSLPESPRWLRLHGKDTAADKVIKKIHGNLDVPKEIYGINSDTYIKDTIKSLESEHTEGKAHSKFRQVWSKDYIRRTSMLWVLWFTTGFAYYGFVTYAPTLLVSIGYSIIDSFGIVLLSYIMQIPGYYSAAWLSEHIGRKLLLAVFMMVGAVTAIILAYSRALDEIIVLYALMSFFLNGLFGAVYIYTPEQYPTSFRTSGMGFASSFARVGAIISPITFGIFLSVIHFSGTFVLTFIIMAIGAVTVLVLGQETTGKDLEQTSAPQLKGGV